MPSFGIISKKELPSIDIRIQQIFQDAVNSSYLKHLEKRSKIMPSFGEKSKRELSTAHLNLQVLFCEVVRHYNCAVIQGRRGKDEQNEYFRTGKSKVQWPSSKHNVAYDNDLCRAVDVVPWFSEKPHIRWNDRESFYHFAGFVKGMAANMNIKIRCGCDWDGDNELHDQTFFDLPHFELID